MVNPSAAMAAKAPMMVTGTVVAGISIARQSCRNKRMTTRTRIAASYRVLYTSWMDCSTNLVVSNGMPETSPGELARQHRHLAAYLVRDVERVRARRLEDRRPAAGLPSSVNTWP